MPVSLNVNGQARDLDVDPATRARLAGPMPGTFNHAGVRIGFWERLSSFRAGTPEPWT